MRKEIVPQICAKKDLGTRRGVTQVCFSQGGGKKIFRVMGEILKIPCTGQNFRNKGGKSLDWEK